MGSLSSVLSIATQSLLATETALSVTNNNIANAGTAGYTRETVNLQEAAPTSDGSVSIGNGVDLVGISSVRDELLTLRIQQQTSSQSSSDAQVTALTQIQTLFPSSGTSLSGSLSSFFTSLSGLSSNPNNTADRQTVISSAQTLVNQFNTISQGLSSPSSSLNTTVTTDVSQINQLSAQAASLNQQVVEQNASGQSSGTLEDQLDQVESQLASLTNLTVTHTANGSDNLTTGNGSPLVLGNQSYNLTTSTGPDGNQQVLDTSGANITASITSGDLGGTIQVRDTQIPALQSQLDTLANQFATAFNAAQAQGYNQNGTQGSALFTIPTDGCRLCRSDQAGDPRSDCDCRQLGRELWKQRECCEPGGAAECKSAVWAERDLSGRESHLQRRGADLECDGSVQCRLSFFDKSEGSTELGVRCFGG